MYGQKKLKEYEQKQVFIIIKLKGMIVAKITSFLLFLLDNTKLMLYNTYSTNIKGGFQNG